MSPKVATSQNAVEPPLPRTISQPEGRLNSVRSPSRMLPTTRFTGAWRCEVPSHEPADLGQRCYGFGPDLGRAATEATVAGQEGVGDTDLRGVLGGHCASMAPVARISARIAAITESATLAVDAKAKALKAQGEDVIGFGAGEPDFPTPDHIVEAAVAACRQPTYHRCTPPAPACPSFARPIAAKTLRDSGFECSAANVVVTNGGKHAVFSSFAVLCDEGDEVLVPAPYWTTYPESITLAGGVPVVLDTDESTGFHVTVEQLEAARTPRTKVLLFVSPDNPSGAVYPPEAVAAIGRWAVEHGIWVVTDEIYEHLTYGDHVFTSMPTLVPRLADTCIILNGVAKTYAMTGWRVGWMIGPKDVVSAATNLQSHSTSNVGNVSQAAALAAVSGDLEAVAMMRSAFAIADGDRGAFDELYARHVAWLHMRLLAPLRRPHRRGGGPPGHLRDGVEGRPAPTPARARSGPGCGASAIRRLLNRMRPRKTARLAPAAQLRAASSRPRTPCSRRRARRPRPARSTACRPSSARWCRRPCSTASPRVRPPGCWASRAGTVKTRMMRARHQLREAIT